MGEDVAGGGWMRGSLKRGSLVGCRAGWCCEFGDWRVCRMIVIVRAPVCRAVIIIIITVLVLCLFYEG